MSCSHLDHCLLHTGRRTRSIDPRRSRWSHKGSHSLSCRMRCRWVLVRLRRRRRNCKSRSLWSVRSQQMSSQNIAIDHSHSHSVAVRLQLFRLHIRLALQNLWSMTGLECSRVDRSIRRQCRRSFFYRGNGIDFRTVLGLWHSAVVHSRCELWKGW